MTLDPAEARQFAERLRAAEVEGTFAPLATQTFPGLDWAGARQIALARDELRRADGDVCIGYKLGWTSAAMREALGIDRPNWGTLWQSQLLGPHQPLRLSRLRHAKVEPEIVYHCGSAAPGNDATANDIRSSAAGWTLGIEVVHPRWPSFDFTWLDNTADNSSAEAVAIGAMQLVAAPLSSEEVTFSDGDASRSGLGAQAMGDPAEAVAWLARELATEGRTIEPGHIVFSGGLTAPFDVGEGSSFTASSSNLGAVEVVAGSSA